MKSQNFMVKFKNSFALTDSEKISPEEPIMKDKLTAVTTNQLSSLIQLYTRDTFENGFNPYLAFRVINLYCYSSDQDNKISNFQLKNQVNRFLNHHLNQTEFQNIQQCMDLLLVDQLRRKLPHKYFKLFKIRVLSCLNKFYLHNKQSIDRKKSTITLREMCKQTLKGEKVKHDEQIYCQIMDILLQLQTRQCQLKLKKKKKFEALQLVNNMIKYLQATQFTLKSHKYQQRLMHSYWYCAELHYQLHYIAYTKKYCEIVINIAQRLQNQQQFKQIAEQLLQKVIL